MLFEGAGRAVRGMLAVGLVGAAAMLAGGSQDAAAWAWSPNVTVVGSVSTCGPSDTSGWGWFQADTGESGWLRWGRGSTFAFDLKKVPGYGASTLVTIRWGAGGCSTARYRVISRPAYGSTAGLGFLG